MELADLNLHFSKCIETGDTVGVERIVQVSLDLKRALELIRDTRQYSFLDILHPILHVGEHESQILAEMFFEASLAGNFEACGIISCFHVTDPVDQSRICGRKGYDLEVVGEDKNLYGYIEGIIETDNPELFRATRIKYADQLRGSMIIEETGGRSIHLLLAKYYAPRIFDEVGYDQISLVPYFINIFSWKNKRLLLHLASKEGFQTSLLDCLMQMKNQPELIPHLKWILAQGVQVSEINWLVIEQEMPELYASCAVDV